MRLALAAAVLFLVVSGCGDEGSSGDDTTRPAEAPAKPVKVTRKHIRYMERTIVAELREQADLTDDYTSDYAARCKRTGRGEATCTITAYDKGDVISRYPRAVEFDPADPSRFRVPEAGITSPKGGP